MQPARNAKEIEEEIQWTKQESSWEKIRMSG